MGKSKHLVAYLTMLIVGIYIGVLCSISNNPNWINLLTALLTPTIAVAGITIGVLQWNINQRRLKHELFDRRITIFDKITHYIGNILTYGTVEHGKENEFLRDTRNAFFIFGRDIEEYVDEIYKKSGELQTLDKSLSGIGDQKAREKNVEKQRILKEWFSQELNSIRPKFDKYLTLKV